MTHESKNITFHVIHVKVSIESQSSRPLPMNVAIESARCGCERNSCKVGFGRRYVERMFKYDQS